MRGSSGNAFGLGVRFRKGKIEMRRIDCLKNVRLCLLRALRLFFPVVMLATAMVWADGPDFCHRPQLAGKASLTVPGFVVRRGLGVANFAPELRLPVELVYDSSSESSGLFGHAWRCPQLESSVRWDKDGLLWTTPWGEQLKFFPKKTGKAAKNAVMIPSVEAEKRGRGLFAPYSD